MKLILLALSLLIISQACVNRADVIAKGMEWVKDKIPYSQTSYHEGYRTDCSGLASCMWRLPKPGYTTWEFEPNKVCAKTTKDRLEKGDFILAPHHHVGIFDGWVDSSKTHYWLIEEGGTKVGTVRRQQLYPYGNTTEYYPCKVLIACPTSAEEENVKV